ncbi:MAG: DNA helicase PcrA [Halanaerobiaceae bacterium]|nr:DNA helicase PcrA [Halanaerobiaceae bacterium]
MSEDRIIAGLNPEQRKAVEHFNGPLLILAGAGSGKTRVLTRRVAYLIEHYGVSPANIMAVTFTNKAANEMKERITDLLGGIQDGLQVSTFHSFCVRVLRRESRKLDYENNFVIYDTADQLTLLKNVMKELNIDSERYNPRAVLAEISRGKNELMGPEEYLDRAGDYFQQITGKVYSLYQQRLQESNAFDFDDLIMKTVELFRKYPMVLEHYQDRFKYISIDEYQDVNTAQYQLVQLLAGKYRNICVVGDPDQGIYGFRGADIRNILNFEKDYPDASIIKLEQNYRSMGKILRAADSVIANNLSRREKRLWTERGEGNNLKYFLAFDEKDEANFVSRTIKELEDKGYSYKDVAVLYRTNSQSRVIEDYFLRYGIPYQIIGGLRFYDRMEIKDLIAYLRVIYNPSDDISLLRIINKPARGIGAGTLGKLTAFAAERDLSLYEACLKVEENSALGAGYRNKVKNFIDMMEDFRADSQDLSVALLMQRILHETGYEAELMKEGTIEAQTRLENIQELFSVMSSFQNEEGEDSLAAFLEEVSLVSDIDTMDETGEHVTLMTIHSAKGLEFPVVFMVGMEEGIFPHSNSMFDEEELEEERRLCYVGITRAMEELYLCSARERLRFGQFQSNPPSRFLSEIPAELISGVNEREENSGLAAGVTDQEDEKGIDSDKSMKSNTYKAGDKIYHPKWGIGVVLSVEDNHGLLLKIEFNDKKVRRLMAEYAPIKRV